jgi:hypothetical protein
LYTTVIEHVTRMDTLATMVAVLPALTGDVTLTSRTDAEAEIGSASASAAATTTTRPLSDAPPMSAAAYGLAGVIAASLVVSTAPAGADVGAPTRSLCGTERWTVKTLQDRPTLLPVRTTTLRFLVTRPAPSTLPSTRQPFERHVYRVTAAATLVRSEDDGDFHLVLRDGALHMIAEAPSTSCVAGATPVRRAQMGTARAAVRVCARAQITGVAFFDYKHGQTGVAANAIELHPILGFRCLSR